MRLRRGKDNPWFDPSKVDLVSLAADGSVNLWVVQPNAWDGSDSEIQALQLKIHNYVSYALDGGMAADYPETVGQPWKIVVHSQAGPPDVGTAQILSVLSERLPVYGGSIEVLVDPD